MTTTEDTGAVEATPESVETTPEITETPVEVATETPTENQEEIDNRVNSLSESDMDELLKAITNGIEGETEDAPTGPVHFESKPAEEDDAPLTEEEMESLEQQLISMDADNETLTATNTDLISQLDAANKALDMEKQKQTDIEEMWSKIMADPTIGPFALQIAQGETPNIPDVMLRQLQKEIGSMPNMQNVEQVSVPKVEKSHAARIYDVKTM